MEVFSYIYPNSYDDTGVCSIPSRQIGDLMDPLVLPEKTKLTFKPVSRKCECKGHLQQGWEEELTSHTQGIKLLGTCG